MEIADIIFFKRRLFPGGGFMWWNHMAVLVFERNFYVLLIKSFEKKKESKNWKQEPRIYLFIFDTYVVTFLG